MDQPKRSLSEISHLFLSEVRERQTGGAARPVRTPPRPRNDVSIDMTPEEFAAAFDDGVDIRPVPSSKLESSQAAQVAVVLASHLADQQSERIRQYARHLASEVGRVGLIEVDGCEFGLICFDQAGGESAEPMLIDELDGRKMSETLAELAFDVDRWIISLPNPKTSEARDILRRAPHWLLLTTADHDGVVATYRTLKGCADLGKPELSLVVLGARDEAEAAGVYRKLDGVSRQFLGCRMKPEPAVQPVPDIAEHVVLLCRATRDKGQLASAPQWQIVADFLVGAVPMEARDEAALMQDQTNQTKENQTNTSEPVSAVAAPVSAPSMSAPSTFKKQDPMNIPLPTETGPLPSFGQNAPMMTLADRDSAEVIDLPPGDVNHASILSAIVRQGGLGGDWVECPVKAPMCPDAVLAVGRDHRLMLLAVAGSGLTELRSIGLAFRWMMENRALLRMALPQLSIDPLAVPMVRLLVDHTDLSADLLQPLLQSSTVMVQAYRKLKWGPKSGLLLEAA